LQSSRYKLEKECEKAKRYKELKAKLLQIIELEKVLIFDKQVKHVESIEKKESLFRKNLSSLIKGFNDSKYQRGY